jgi:hypothetical protein
MCRCHTEESIPQSNNKVWHPDDKAQATPSQPGSNDIYRPDILETIEAKIKELDGELRELSLDIHGMSFQFNCFGHRSTPIGSPAHPELAFEE